MSNFHTPVLVKETLKYLDVGPNKKYIDATLGGGGHAAAIMGHGGQILGIDQDPEAITAAKRRLIDAYPVPRKKLRGPVDKPILVTDNFTNLKNIAEKNKFSKVSGILFDLGASTHQLTSPKRGFSFLAAGELDMRMDPKLAVKAADLVNGLGKKELYALFTKLAQEQRARAIADAIVRTRRQKPITTTGELAGLVEQVYQKRRFSPGKLHPATKVFQALRIAVNDELNNLRTALPQAIELLKPQGRLVVISFHQGEDRIVKHYFKDQEKKAMIKILTKKPLTPSPREITKNPNARSAKLRVAEKI